MFQNLNRDARMVPRQEMVAPSLLPGHTGERIGRDLTPKHRGAARGVGRVSGAPEDAWGCGRSERHHTTFVEQNTTSDTAPSTGKHVFLQWVFLISDR